MSPNPSTFQKKVAAVIVAAGLGTRVGGEVPKQFRMLQGKRVVDWSISTCLKSPLIDEVVVVLPSDWIDTVKNEWEESSSLTFVNGGETRTQSVLAGLHVLNRIDQVLIHDAARPGINSSIINAVLTRLENCDGVAPVIGIPDTVKRITNKDVTTVDRSELFRVQTPQAFDFQMFYNLLSKSRRDYTDDLQVLEASGKNIGVVKGQSRLTKLTVEDDFDNFKFDLNN